MDRNLVYLASGKNLILIDIEQVKHRIVYRAPDTILCFKVLDDGRIVIGGNFHHIDILQPSKVESDQSDYQTIGSLDCDQALLINRLRDEHACHFWVICWTFLERK